MAPEVSRNVYPSGFSCFLAVIFVVKQLTPVFKLLLDSLVMV